jgi:CspA family cold shock protein
MAETSENVTRVMEGAVKWFDAGKGFGFIIDDEGGPDILLHANVLRNFGMGSVADGARISVRAQATERGMQASEILEIIPPEGNDESLPGLDVAVFADAPFLPARIKWFDKAKGFGFANVFGKREDVFVHVEILRRCGLADLMPGEAVAMKVVDGPRGKMAAEVRSWDFI